MAKMRRGGGGSKMGDDVLTKYQSCQNEQMNKKQSINLLLQLRSWWDLLGVWLLFLFVSLFCLPVSVSWWCWTQRGGHGPEWPRRTWKRRHPRRLSLFSPRLSPFPSTYSCPQLLRDLTPNDHSSAQLGGEAETAHCNFIWARSWAWAAMEERPSSSPKPPPVLHQPTCAWEPAPPPHYREGHHPCARRKHHSPCNFSSNERKRRSAIRAFKRATAPTSAKSSLSLGSTMNLAAFVTPTPDPV